MELIFGGIKSRRLACVEMDAAIPKPQIWTSSVLGDVAPDSTYFVLQNGKELTLGGLLQVYLPFAKIPCSLECVHQSGKQKHFPLPYDSVKTSRIVTEHSTVTQPL